MKNRSDKTGIFVLVALSAQILFAGVLGVAQAEDKLLVDNSKDAAHLLRERFNHCDKVEIKGPNHSKRKDGVSPRVFASTTDVSVIKKFSDLILGATWMYDKELQGETYSSSSICELRLWNGKRCHAKFVLIANGTILMLYEIDGGKVEMGFYGDSNLKTVDKAWELYNQSSASWENKK